MKNVKNKPDGVDFVENMLYLYPIGLKNND